MVFLMVTVVFLMTMMFLMVPMVLLLVVFICMFFVMDWSVLIFMCLMKNNALRRISMTLIMTVVEMVLRSNCCNRYGNEEDLFDNRKT
ncbi:unnamed protein product [Arctia plantaginis]|uniref:Uncharacterized protein n=1 Tax=Arctia plantaginis TaxID=874455 RepID=A0A8S1ACS8_ARCPL|nr:unnamed protein product [Arctia plantaginis]